MKKRDKITSFLGKDTWFEGNLKFCGTIRIDGHFKGEISGNGTLMVGKEAMIESDIHASYILISGEIQGNIIADERTEIRAPAKVFGNIQTPILVIDEGVSFEGDCRMDLEDEDDKGKLVPISSVRSKDSSTSSLKPTELNEGRIYGAQ